jgi:hypothetical protein
MPRYQYPKGHKKLGGKQKGTRHEKTIIREKIANTLTLEQLVDKNIEEFLSSDDLKTRMEATKYLSEFVKPKKRQQELDIKGTIIFQVNPLIAGKNYKNPTDNNNNSVNESV